MQEQENKVSEEVEVQPEEQEISINQEKLDNYLEQLKLDQNLMLGLLSGFVASLVGAIIWAVITVSTEYQIGYMAVAVGFIVGYAIRYTGKGLDNIFGISGAVLALFGCLLGNFLSIIGFAANAEGLGYFEIIPLIDFTIIPSIMIETFNPMDILFYGIAIYEGYKFSFRQITEEELVEHAT